MNTGKHNDPGSLRADFKAAMRQLAASVTIVTTGVEGQSHGMTATAVTSLCAEPPSILVCVNRSASIHPVLAVGQPFCVNMLQEHHADLSSAFGGGVEPENRFKHGSWEYTSEGIPYLRDAASSVFGSVEVLLGYGTHTIVIGRVSSARTNHAAHTLLHGSGRFLTVIPVRLEADT